MSYRDTVDWGKAEAAMLQAGAELLERMAHHMEGAAKRFCPVDTGELWNSITIVSAGGAVPLASGQVIAAFDTGDTARAVHVVAYAPYALPVEYGHMTPAGNFVPPNPFMRNAVADTIGAFDTIVNAELFSPFRTAGGEVVEARKYADVPV